MSLVIQAAVTLPFCLTVASTLYAQSGSSPSELIEEVLVTGSRIDRESGFVAPQPITSVSEQDFANRAATNIQEILYDLPQVQRDNMGGTGSGNPGGDYVNLRSLGATRNLVLIDGRRVVPSNINGSVDLNTIPSSMVQRLEIVTGGASAAWGSDAVSGVTNIILKKDFEGLEASAQYDATEYGDGKKTTVTLAGGNNFMDDRLNLSFGAEMAQQDEISNISNRDWFRPFAAIQDSRNGPDHIQVDNATFSRMTAGGVIHSANLLGFNYLANPGNLPGLQFANDGSLIPFNYGGGPIDGVHQAGGDGGYLGDEYNVLNPTDRSSLFTRASFNINEDTNFFFEASYASNESLIDIIIPYDFSLTFRRDNAFISNELAARMDSVRATSFTMGRLQYEYGADTAYGRNQTVRFAGGLDGQINDNWSYSAYYQQGQNDYAYEVAARIVSRFAQQIDSIKDPVTGLPVCRNASGGCVPVNLFGAGKASAEAVDWANGIGTFDSEFVQKVAAVTLQGEMGDLWAGPVLVATGVEWRKETLVGVANDLAETNSLRLGNPSSIAGKDSVAEGFVEAVIPLADGGYLAQQSELNVAARFAQYDLAGSATTWKVGFSHTFTDEYRLRATFSYDLRAPKINELFSPRSAGSGVVFDPLLGISYRVPAFVTTGNTELAPEFADTLTYGFVYTPDFIDGLQLSLDYYDIDITDAIGTINGRSLIERCHVRNETNLCQFIERNAVNNRIIQTTSKRLNLDNLRSSGVDFESSYRFQLAGGRMSLRLLTTKILEDSTLTAGVVQDDAGQVGNSLRGTFITSWTGDRLNLSGNMRYVGSGKRDNYAVVNDGRTDNYGSEVYLGASLRYNLIDNGSQQAEIWVKVENLLDSAPPIFYASSQQPPPTNTAMFDALGRRYSIGVKYAF